MHLQTAVSDIRAGKLGKGRGRGQSPAPVLNKVLRKPAERLFFRYWRDDDARVVQAEGVVKPQEIAVATQHAELWFAISWRIGLQGWQ